MNFVDLITSKQNIELHLLAGQRLDGKMVFFFMAMRRDRAKALRVDLIGKDCDLIKYGVIVHSGYGYPSEQVIAATRQDFENGLITLP